MPDLQVVNVGPDTIAVITLGVPGPTGEQGPEGPAGSISFPALAPDGSCAAPSYSFTNEATGGLWFDPAVGAAGAVVISDHSCTNRINVGASIELITEFGPAAATGGRLTLTGTAGFSDGGGFTLTAGADASNNNTGAFLSGNGGDNAGGGGGSFILRAGVGGVTDGSGEITAGTLDLRTKEVGGSSFSRLTFNPDGEWIISGSSSVAGDVITSNGPGLPPSWQAAAGGASFPLLAPDGSVTEPSYSFNTNAATGLYFDSGANEVVLAFNDDDSKVRVGAHIFINARDFAGNTGALAMLQSGFGATGGQVTLNGGSGGDTGASGGSVQLTGGASADSAGGNIGLTGGSAVSAALAGGVFITTNGTQRLLVGGAGEWYVGGLEGTAGDVLTSAGAGAPPTWQAPAGGGTPDLYAENPVAHTPPAAGGDNSVAIGSAATTTGNNGVAVGTGATIGAFISGVAIGNGASVSGDSGIAIGAFSIASDSAVVLGVSASSGINGVALGTATSAIGSGTSVGAGAQSNSGAVAIGEGADGTATGAVAVGNAANAGTGTRATAVGIQSVATGAEAVAIGESSTASGAASVAIGSDATANAADAIAIGDGALSSGGSSSIAIGGDSTAATGAASIAMSRLASATATNAIAIGNSAGASDTDAVALGEGATAGGAQSIAIGSDANVNASGTGSIAIGDGTVVGAFANTVALGAGATPTAANQVMIGNGSVTEWVPMTTAVTSLGSAALFFLNLFARGLTLPGTNITFAATPYAVLATDFAIFVDTSGGAVEVDLPASPVNGRIINIKKVTTDSNNITIDGNGKTIDSASSITSAAVNRPNLQLLYDSANNDWRVL